MSNNLIVKLEVLGQYEKPFHILKFRTMYPNAHADYPDLVKKNGLDYLGKVLDDPRITPLGKFLRRYFIDELPQFYNLIQGDISLVGIRAKNKENWGNFSANHKQRALKYKPGLLGVHYSLLKLNSFEHFVEVESEYLDEIESNGKAKTDEKYFFKICENIIFKGLRSR